MEIWTLSPLANSDMLWEHICRVKQWLFPLLQVYPHFELCRKLSIRRDEGWHRQPCAYLWSLWVWLCTLSSTLVRKIKQYVQTKVIYGETKAERQLRSLVGEKTSIKTRNANTLKESAPLTYFLLLSTELTWYLEVRALCTYENHEIFIFLLILDNLYHIYS